MKFKPSGVNAVRGGGEQDMGQYSEDSEWEAAEDGRPAQEAKVGKVKHDDDASAGLWHGWLTINSLHHVEFPTEVVPIPWICGLVSTSFMSE